MPMTAKEMVKLLKKNGFVEVRQCGSHKRFVNKETGRMTSVPFPYEGFTNRYRKKHSKTGRNKKIIFLTWLEYDVLAMLNI